MIPGFSSGYRRVRCQVRTTHGSRRADVLRISPLQDGFWKTTVCSLINEEIPICLNAARSANQTERDMYIIDGRDGSRRAG